jgi:predicted acyltransferase
MFLMIFVNDLWSLHDIPKWLEHTAAKDDGMGLADTVFPAFLFIVGMSIPYAISNRIKKGDTLWQLVRHVIERSIALLVMGLFFVNGENLNAEATGMPRGVWNIICCICFIFIWNQYPAKFPKTAQNVIRGVGIITLLMMAWICRGGEGDELQRFSTYWWGILGLIGWAYLVSAMIYVLGKGSFMVNSMAVHGDVAPGIFGYIADGAMPALVLGGVLVSQIFRHYSTAGKWQSVIGVLSALAVVLLTAGFLTRPIWGISKIMATPSWVLICSAITIGIFIFTYWLADLQQKASWFKGIKAAGTDTLLCYLIPYFVYALFSLAHYSFPDMISGGAIGIVKSLVFSFLMIQIAGWISKGGIRLKL